MTAEEEAHICCTDCRASIDADDAACPSCGSPNRSIDVRDAGQGHEEARLKARREGIRKPYRELIIGEEKRESNGRWVHKVREIDRENDRYFERVTDSETGEVIHESNEPLSEHRGYGSAKTR